MRTDRARGSAVVEAALMLPWLAFLFVGLLDFGFYAYAAICTQNAARAAAMRTSYNLKAQQFAYANSAAVGELNGLPNMSGVSACAASPGSISGSQPCAVVLNTLTCATAPLCADCGAATTCIETPPPSSVQVAVTYRSLPMIPIPGILMGQMTLTRIAEMRIIQR
jgi:hypothetical protein